MKKITYKLSNLFTLKKYDNSNLNCQSYEYITAYAIRSAILGTIIQLDGIDKAQELFHKVKNAIIYIQYPMDFKKNNCRIKRFANSYYKLTDEDKIYRDKLIKNNFNTTMGFRQYVDLEEIVFYIDSTIPELELYLKNIDWLGASESLVYLDKIEETSYLENVMSEWNKADDVDIYEQFDWGTKAKFGNIYFYSDEYKHVHKQMMCCIRNISV